MYNPLLELFDTPFQTPPFHLIKEEDYKPAFQQAIASGRAQIDAIINSTLRPDFANTIEALEYAGGLLNDISNIFFNLNHAHTNTNLQQIAREVSPWLTEFSNDIWLNDTLFVKVKQVKETIDITSLQPHQIKLLDDTYKSFVRRGALLNGAAKERYRQITTELSDLSLQFGENVLAETNAFALHITNADDLDGLPDALVEMAKQEAEHRKLEGWVFTLHFPSYGPFMKYSKKRHLRQQMFMAYSSRAHKGNEHDNKNVIKRIVSLRLEKAKLLGYSTHADYVLEERMAQSTERVTHFLNDLLVAATPFARKEMDEVTQLAHELGLHDTIQRWDFAFYSEILKARKFNIDDETVRPYFRLDRVEEGVFMLASKLFGLSFTPSDTIPVYHNEVKPFEVYDEKGDFIAVLYLDYFPRPSKQGGAWMTSFRDQHLSEGKDVRPVISLVMNFTRPTETKPSLLTYNEVHTFLHEFGHALHGMLSKVQYQSQAGTSVYRDFVELPSQMLENWAAEKEWLNQVALHFQTDETIPAQYVESLIASEQFQSGYATLRQLGFGLVDMAWHTINDSFEGDVVDFEKEAMSSTDLFPEVNGICTCTSFSHIFDGGYAAGYYGYKWAEVLDADAFECFKQNGIFDKKTAGLFRRHILEKGGSAHPMELYLAFRGQEPTVDALLKRSGLK
jgi:peptidyl-dipeptidase Dcp